MHSLRLKFFSSNPPCWVLTYSTPASGRREPRRFFRNSPLTESFPFRFAPMKHGAQKVKCKVKWLPRTNSSNSSSNVLSFLWMTQEQRRRARARAKAKYYRRNKHIWERLGLRRKRARGFTPKVDWGDREAVRVYDRERNRAYREAHPGWTAAKCKRWRAKVAKEKRLGW
jgi:hypothetical protein